MASHLSNQSIHRTVSLSKKKWDIAARRTTLAAIYFTQEVILGLRRSHYWYVDHSYMTALINSDKSRSD